MQRFTKVISVLWIINFVVYVCVAFWLGGDAINGHSEAGNYYLAMGGRSTEVSREVFEFSRWYTYALLAHFAVAFILGMAGGRRSKARG